jgi:hypothetical protein
LSKDIISGEKNISMLEMSLKMTDTINLPAIRSVFKDNNGQIGFSVVKVLVKRFMESFGFSTKPSELMIETITVDCLDKFSYESLNDIIIFFKMARSGTFGNTDRGVDSNLIFGKWLPMYLDKKSERREDLLIAEKNKMNENLVSIHEVKKSYNILQKEQLKKDYNIKVQKRIDEITKDFDRQMLEDLIFEWEKDPTKKQFLNILKKKRKIIK